MKDSVCYMLKIKYGVTLFILVYTEYWAIVTCVHDTRDIENIHSIRLPQLSLKRVVWSPDLTVPVFIWAVKELLGSNTNEHWSPMTLKVNHIHEFKKAA